MRRGPPRLAASTPPLVAPPAVPPSTGPRSGGSNASACPSAASAASIIVIGVPARAESTSSSGSYSVIPTRPETSSVCSTCSGRPMPRLVPPATISSGVSAAAAQATASRIWSAVSGLRTLLMTGPSEPGDVGERQLAAPDVHAAKFGTAVEGREHLARIEQPVGIERALDPLLLLEVDFGEHLAHQVALLDADAVFAGQHAALFGAQLQDVGPERLGAPQLIVVVRVIQDERMQVAIAGMEHVGAAQAVLALERRNPCQHLRQPAARYGPVHA